MDFSLFYFAAGAEKGSQCYRLLLDGARFADENDFTAVWTPERHFHEFGGRYPNPSVTGAAIAAVTKRVGIRAGSVVAPLHDPIRIAEEWSVVDNLSDGRVGLSFASGWRSDDFVFRPDAYADRRTETQAVIETVRKLWRGESIELPNGSGQRTVVRTCPVPVQSELPVWLTSSGHTETFRTAGRMGAGVLTHLLGQELDLLGKKIGEYRAAFREHQGQDAGPGHVALMLHTFLADDREQARETVREPFSEYLRQSLDLFKQGDLDPEDVEVVVARSFDRYFDAAGLFGTVDDGMRVLRELDAIGVDEVACLIDFVADVDTVLAGLPRLARLARRWRERAETGERTA